ncbi:MAG: D-alanyl-D-alanine carboxypeptidase family protein [Candidatus Gracilibacteria bacterium]
MLNAVFSLLGFSQPIATLPPASVLEIVAPPQLRGEELAPVVKAEAALVMDVKTGSILFEKNAQTQLPIASLTKLVTALVAKENYQLNDVVVVSENADKQPPAEAHLLTGEEITVENLLKALLINSANDAATALAEKMGEEEFVVKMNDKVSKLGLLNTHFSNAVGYDEEGNYSTAYDLARLAGYFLRDDLLREIVATQSTMVASVNGGIRHQLSSTNKLYGTYLTMRGLKTGTTDEAGECFAGIAEGENGQQVLAIVLNSPSRMQEDKALLTWALTNFRWGSGAQLICNVCF